MSRCFTFPPPGYVLNGSRDEAMIVSIKGAEEKAKKEHRKERKRDKERKDKKERKDNKKERKDKKDKKRNKREGKEGESEKHSHKRRHKGDIKDGSSHKVDLFRKLKESEIDCLEKSCLTVEHELFHSTSQNSCDSTLNSNEILRKHTLDGGRHNNDSESIIRIRLPNRRQKDPEVMITNKDHEKPSPSRGIKLDTSQLVTREPVNQHPCSTSAPQHASRPREEKRKDHILSTKVNKEKISSTSTSEACQPSSLCRICPPSMAVQFLNVVENWVPDTIEKRVEDLTNLDNEECWWFMKKPGNHRFDTERCKQLNINNEIKQVSSSMVWPFARLLPEADVYAVPYAVPF